MADTNKTTRTLGVLVTGQNATDTTKTKTVTIKIPNPRTNLQESDFTQDIKDFIEASAIYGGKLENSPDTHITGAYVENKSITDLDLTGL